MQNNGTFWNVVYLKLKMEVVKMKKSFLIGFIILTVLLSVVAISGRHLPQGKVVAQDVDMNHTISVSGEGVVQAVPDITLINFSIVIQKKTAHEAMSELSTVANRVITVLKNAGVKDENIKTLSINLYPVYQWDKDHRTSTLIGYKATESFQISTVIKDAGRIIGLITENGVNNISGIRFDVSDKVKLQQEAITDAVENARRKAEATLKNTNYKIVGIKTISVSSASPFPIYRNGGYTSVIKESAQVPVEGGSFNIKAHVEVIFIFD